MSEQVLTKKNGKLYIYIYIYIFFFFNWRIKNSPTWRVLSFDSQKVKKEREREIERERD